MFLWLSLAVLAQFFSALTVFIDKYVLVAKTGFQHPAAFAFFTALLSAVVLVLLPFGVVGWPSGELFSLSLLSGITYLTSLLFLYRALQVISVTEVIPVTAASSAIMTGILAAIFLQSDLPIGFLPAFLLLVVGTFLIYCFCFHWRFLLMAVASGALVGASTFSVKLAFEYGDFWTALFWALFANVIVAVLMLAPFRYYAIRHALTVSSGAVKGLALLSKSLGGVAFILTFFSISIGSVSIVNALGGLQLVFLLLLVPIFMRRLPDIFRGEMLPGTVFLKVLGTFLIVAGLAFLFISS